MVARNDAHYSRAFHSPRNPFKYEPGGGNLLQRLPFSSGPADRRAGPLNLRLRSLAPSTPISRLFLGEIRRAACDCAHTLAATPSAIDIPSVWLLVCVCVSVCLAAWPAGSAPSSAVAIVWLCLLAMSCRWSTDFVACSEMLM